MAFGLQDKAMLQKLEELEREVAALKLQSGEKEMGEDMPEALAGEEEEIGAEMDDMLPEEAEEDPYAEMDEEDAEMARQRDEYMKGSAKPEKRGPSGIMIALNATPKGEKPKPKFGGKKRKRGY